MVVENSQHETYIISKRNPAEVQRLNWQHNYVRKCMNGNLILPNIPYEKVHSIADVGCGTGIWLQSVTEDATLPSTADGITRSYHGFDISADMFPPENERNGIEYSTLNILQPVPEEFIGKFDLVAVRALCLGIKVDDFGIALDNLVSMIKPGGYLQWVEINKDQAQKPSDPLIFESNQRMDAFWTSSGFVHDPIMHIQDKYAESIPLTSIKRYDYPWTSKHVIEDSVTFAMNSWRAIWPQVLLRSGDVETWDEAMKQTEESLERMKNLSGEELCGNGSWACLSAQKRI